MQDAADPELPNQHPGAHAPLRRTIKFVRDDKSEKVACVSQTVINVKQILLTFR